MTMSSNAQDPLPSSAKESNLPPFTSHNSPTLPTILFIHGAGATGANNDVLLPYLKDYHILLPTLPQHGTNSTPLTLASATSQLASLIQLHGNNSIAHIVGHSLGTHIALDLAHTHPDLVSTIFLSGFGLYTGNSLVPYALWCDSRLSSLLPASVLSWAMDGTTTEGCAPPRLAVCKAVAGLVASEVWPEPWEQRTLVVVAGKGGVIPTADSRADAVRLVGIGRMGCGETKGVVHARMRHPWNRQDPELFAKAVIAWIKGKKLPDGFMDLE